MVKIINLYILTEHIISYMIKEKGGDKYEKKQYTIYYNSFYHDNMCAKYTCCFCPNGTK